MLEISQLVELDSMVIDNPPPSQDDPVQLSTQLLQTAAANRQVECDLWKKNGNIIPRKAKATGAPLDALCCSLVIERIKEKGSGKGMATYYYCIACDDRCANNARNRALPHVKNCGVRAFFQFSVQTRIC
jgi:hypothetical protein